MQRPLDKKILKIDNLVEQHLLSANQLASQLVEFRLEIQSLSAEVHRGVWAGAYSTLRSKEDLPDVRTDRLPITLPGGVEEAPDIGVQVSPIKIASLNKSATITVSELRPKPKMTGKSFEGSSVDDTSWHVWMPKNLGRRVMKPGFGINAKKPRFRNFAATGLITKDRSGRIFASPDDLKEKVKENLAEEPFEKENYFHTAGLPQALARSDRFTAVSLAMVILSCFWLGFELDLNDADVLPDAHPVFQIVAHGFCLFFTFEVLVRFFAYQSKLIALHDYTLLFDALLVIFIVIETWIISCLALVFGFSAASNLKALTVLRLLRLLRVLRLTRVLREWQELLVIVKGLVHAFRAISVIMVLLAFIIYMAALLFRVLLNDTTIGAKRFSSVPQSMGTLLIDGTLSGAKGGPIMKEAYDDSLFYAACLLGYVVLANVTMMGVLGGLLVRTVATVADVENEEKSIMDVKDTMVSLWEAARQVDEDGDGKLSLSELHELVRDQEACKSLHSTGVDVDGLVYLSEGIFKQYGGALTKSEFIKVLLDLRGKNIARVKDLVETRKFIHAEFRKPSCQPGAVRIDSIDSTQSCVGAPPKL